jgi:hypothetical protein
MQAIDYKQDPTYKAKTQPQLIDIPKMLFVMVDGEGAPEAAGTGQTQFQAAMQVLFGIVYMVKFWDKKYKPPKNYTKFSLPPVEGLWWTKSGRPFDLSVPDDWQWTLMIRLPEFVTPDYFKQVVDELIVKKQSDIYKNARLAHFEEGKCVQIMHIGPYDQELPNIEKMHAFASDNGYKAVGKHHELYFGALDGLHQKNYTQSFVTQC